MHRIILYVTALLCLLVSKTYGQQTESFDSQIKTISDNITEIIALEQQKLKKATDSINVLVQQNKLTQTQADEIKSGLAQKSEETIATKIAPEQEKITTLVQQTVDEQIGTEIEEKTEKKPTQSRTYASTNWKLGALSLIGGKGENLNGVNFSVGFIIKDRLLKDYGKLYITYGFDYNSHWFFPDSNQHFVTNGNQTQLTDYNGKLLGNSHFLNSYLRLPLGLELDFSKKSIVNEEEVFKVNRNFRVGFGTYLSYNIDSRQTLIYRENGRKITRSKRGDWNVSDWEYGLSAYVMYRHLGFYVDYSLNPVFRNNPENQNVISFGIIFN